MLFYEEDYTMKKLISLVLVIIFITNCIFCVLASENAIALGGGITYLTLADASSSDANSDGKIIKGQYCTYNLSLDLAGSYRVSVVAKTSHTKTHGTVLLDGNEQFSMTIPISTDFETTEVGVLSIPEGNHTFKYGIKYHRDEDESLYIDSFVFERVADVTNVTLQSASSGVTNGNPRTSMNGDSYADYSFASLGDSYGVYATVMATEDEECEITAKIGDEVVGSSTFKGIGWDSRYSREYYLGDISVEEGKQTLRIINSGTNALRVWNVRLMHIPLAKDFITELNAAQTKDDIKNVLYRYNDSYVIPYGDYLDNIYYQDVLLGRLLRFTHTSLMSTDDLFMRLYNEEIQNPFVSIEQNGKNVTKLSNGEFTVTVNPKFSKDVEVIAALYNEEGTILKDFKKGTLHTDASLTLTGLRATEQANKLKIFFLDYLSNIKPASIFTNSSTLYVSASDGNDENDGLSSASPLKSIEAVINRINELNSYYPRNIIVNLEGGEYILDETIILDDTFSSYEDYGVKFVSADKNNPAIISGGYDVTGWKPLGYGGIYVSDIIPDEITDVRQLYIDENPAQRARSEEYIYSGESWDDPKTDYGQDGFYVDLDDYHSLDKPADAEIAYSIKWTLQRLPVKSIEGTEDGRIIFKMDQPYYSTAITMVSGGGTQPKPGNKIYFENDLSLLDREGEFYFDKDDRRIYYKPFEEEDLNSLRCVIPKVEQLIIAEGSSVNKKLRNITFENVNFIYGGYYTEPNAEGAVSIQAEELVDASKGLNKDPNAAGVGRKLPSQIEFKNADNINFVNCDISCMGSSALSLGIGVTNSSVKGCSIIDVGGSALSIGQWSSNETNIAENIEIKNNVISHTGLDFMSSPAVIFYYGKNIDILHNDISDTPYSGISNGWGWMWDYTVIDGNKTQNPSFANRVGIGGHDISYNKIDSVSRALNDGGHIYNVGYMIDTQITNNYLLNSPDAGGVYLDTGASNIKIKNNVFVNCERGGISYGRSEHAVNNLAEDNWTNTPQKITKSQADWPGNNCIFNVPVLVSDGNWPSKAMEIMESAGVEPEYILNLQKAEKPSWRTLDFFAHLEKEKLPEGSIPIVLENLAACRLNNKAATSYTFTNLYRHFCIENFHARDALIYEVEAPSAGEYYLEIGYDTYASSVTLAVAVNRNLKEQHYNQDTGTYVWNKAGCTYFLDSNYTSFYELPAPTTEDTPRGQIQRIEELLTLNKGTNELYIGGNTIKLDGGNSYIRIKTLRLIPKVD